MRFIVCGDFHLRSDLPRCRLDKDWLGTQEKQIKWIFEQAEKYNAAVIHTGDMFHRSVSSVGLANWALELLKPYKDNFISIPGNHDLPNHSVEKLGGSAYGIIEKALGLHTHNVPKMVCFPFSTESPGESFGKEIVVLHRLIVESELENVPKSMWSTAASVLNEFPDAKWIFTGDNHGGFAYQNERNQVLVNPGSLNRQSASGMDYKPRVYLVDTDIVPDIVEPNNKAVELLFIPDDIEMVFDSYLTEEKERDERILAFVEKAQDGFIAGLSFEDNVRDYLITKHDLNIRQTELIKEICL